MGVRVLGAFHSYDTPINVFQAPRGGAALAGGGSMFHHDVRENALRE